jgi:hypothetical protein
MEAQAVIHMAGSLAEAIHRGERRRHQVLAFAKAHCHLDAEMTLAEGVLADLRRLRAYDEQRIVDRTLAVLLTHWEAVEGVAQALIQSRRIEGDEVERIIDGLSVSAYPIPRAGLQQGIASPDPTKIGVFRKPPRPRLTHRC